MTTLPRHGAALPGRGRGVRHHREVFRPSDRQPAFPLTGVGVAGSRFHVARFGRRYAMPAVDDYLDGAESTLRARGAGGVPEDRPVGGHRSTWWVYAVAAALIALIVAFVVTQL